MKQADRSQPSPGRLVKWIVELPRLTRIVLALVFALAVTLAITPLVDAFYLDHFFDVNTRMAPSLVSTALGVAFYILGWRLMIGYVGENPPPRPALLWYFGVGAGCCLLVAILVVFGAITGSMT